MSQKLLQIFNLSDHLDFMVTVVTNINAQLQPWRLKYNTDPHASNQHTKGTIDDQHSKAQNPSSRKLCTIDFIELLEGDS